MSDVEQVQSELASKNEELEAKVDELMQRIVSVEVERDGLRSELNETLLALEDTNRKLDSLHQVDRCLPI